MKIGKVSQNVLKRSMLKPLGFKREEALMELSVEEMCFGVSCKEDEQLLFADTVLYGNEKDLGVFALARVMNDLATRGADMVGMSVHIMLPPYAYESRLKTMTEHIEQAGSAHGVQVLCAKAEISPAIKKAIVYLSGVGIVKKGKILQSAGGKPGQDVVLLKWVGLEGTFRVMREKEKELVHRFVPAFLHKISKRETELFSAEEIKIAREHGVSAMHQITEGGIFAALWEMAESSRVGLEVDLKAMSILQETVEICEYFHLNPYQITSAGSVLIFTERGEELVEKYAELGICASLLGRTTADKQRVILGGEEKRFIDKPAPDELLKIYEEELI